MASFEFSKWDGSQQFRPLSADAVFDKVAEHLLEYGDYVLRQLEHLDEQDTDLVKLLVKEGYLEKDEEGKVIVTENHLRAVVELSKDFQVYLDQLHKGDESKRAERKGERLDNYVGADDNN